MEQSRRLVAARTRSEETRVIDELRRNHFLRARLETVNDRDANDRERQRRLREELLRLESANHELESRIRRLLLGGDC